MKLQSASLQLKKFSLLKFEFKLTAAPENRSLIQNIFKEYDININFAWKKAKTLDVVFCKIEINRVANSKPGYAIYAEGAGFFEINDSLVSEGQKNSFLQISATSIVVQELRSVMRYNTSLGPLGAYLLPTIDMTEQIKEKVKLTVARKKPKTGAKSEK
jgi:hypothetical protein